MNKLIRCVIIDDEANNVNLLRKMLGKLCPAVDVMATETDAIKGLALLADKQPDLVFLDIQMPKMNGFELLKKLEPVPFDVIFVTAFAEYAIEAFEFHAVGYLTKPIVADKLVSTVNHAITRIEQKNGHQDIFSLLEARMQQTEATKIPLSTMNGLLFVNKEEIIYCESSGNYTHFYLLDGRKIVVSRQLGEFERLLSDAFFVRIHDRYIINLKYVTEYIKGRGGDVKLMNHVELPVSINRKELLLARFDKWLKR